MTRKEAARRLKKIVDEIYDKLVEMEDILKEVDPEELERAEAYWFPQIDEALLNLLGDALGTLEEDDN